MAWFLSHWGDLLQATLMLFGAASILARLTPTQSDDKIIGVLLRLIQGLGLNKTK